MSDSVGKISIDLEVQSDLDRQIKEAAANIGKSIEKAISNSGMGSQLSNVVENFSRMFNQVIKKTLDNLSSQIDILLRKMTQFEISFNLPKDVKPPKMPVVPQASPRAPPVGVPKVESPLQIDVLENQMRNLEAVMENVNAKIILQKSKLKELKSQYESTFNTAKKSKIEEQMLNTQGRINALIQRSDALTVKFTELESKSLRLKGLSKMKFADMAGSIAEANGLSTALNNVRTSALGASRAMGIINGFKVRVPAANIAPALSGVTNLKTAVAQMGTQTSRASVMFGNMTALMKRCFSFQGVKNLLGSITRLPAALRNTSNAMSKLTTKTHSFSRAVKSAKTNNDYYKNGLGGTIKQMFKWMIVLPMIVKGITAMATSLFQSLQTNDQFNNSLQQIKSNLMVAFTPIFQAILPAINALMSGLSKATAYVASFISQLFGKSFSQSFGATQQLISAKDAMGVYGTTSQKAAKGVKQATKANEALKRSLMGFDQINKLDDNDTSSTDTPDADSGEASNAPTLVKPMIDTSLLDASTIPWVNKFKEVLKGIFKPFNESWAAEGQNTINAAKSALNNVCGLIKSIGGSFMEVWTNGTGTTMLTTIHQILQNIFGIVGNIADGFRKAWEQNGTGTAIIQSVFDILNTVLDTINRITGATKEWAGKLNFTPLLESVKTLLEAMEPLVQNIGDGLAWFWENVLLPVAGWTIETAVPTFLDMLSAGIDVLNTVIEALKPAGEWLFENLLKPLGEWVGDLFIAGMETITDLLKKFSDWCGENQATIENIAIVIGSFIAAWGIVNLVTTITGIVTALGAFIISGGLASGVATLLGTAIAFLTSPITIAIAIIGSLIAAGILLWKNWDKITEIFKKFDNFLQNVFTKDWTKQFGLIGNVFNAFFKTVQGIWDSVKKIFGGIIDFVKGVFAGDWEKAWNGVVDIFEGVFGLLESIVKAPLNGVIGLLNMAIDGLNSISVDIPDWVPLVGGSHFGLSIPKIPMLAQGGYVKANTPQLAMIGDNRHQGEVVAPEGKMLDMAYQAARMAGGSSNAEVINLLKEILKRLKDRKLVEINEESLRRYFVERTNRNTFETGVCEIIV